MSFSGESEGEEEGGGRGGIAFHILRFSWYPNLDHWTRYMTVRLFLMYNVVINEVGHEALVGSPRFYPDTADTEVAVTGGRDPSACVYQSSTVVHDMVM